jgi:prepilin-type N-terminal cleavage/methylation domain-containing protein
MRSSRHLGFTLIELLIAIGLGLMIVYTATAAFRVAAQSVTTANRLSLENAVLRAGYQLAHHDLDFWTNVDDPAKGRIGLRAGGPAAGMPFTPFSVSWSTGSTSDAESATGHDPRDVAWAMGNPRVWWRGNMAEKNNTDLRFGRYSLFANRSTSLTADKLASIRTSTGTDAMGNTTYANYTYGGPVQVPHSWLYGQISGLEKALGFYGLCDYLPSNAVYAYYVPWDDGCNLGGLPKWMIDPGGGFNNGDGGQQTPRGKYRNSYMTSYGIIDPRSTNDSNTLRQRHRRHYRLGYGSNEDNQNEFNSWSAIPDDHLAIRPVNWPGLEVSVQRFIKNTRFVNLARVRWTNPMTGQTAELSFTGFGTTLRGARQQRAASGGWAAWDNNGGTNPATLDGN